MNEHKQAGEIENSKMVDINLNVSIITLKVNTLIKRQRLTIWRQKEGEEEKEEDEGGVRRRRQKSTICCLQRCTSARTTRKISTL